MRGRVAAGFVLGFAVAFAALWAGRPASVDQALRCNGQRFDLVATSGASSPYVNLTADGKAGAFLLDTGATISSLSQSVFGGPHSQLGERIKVERFDLPTFPTGWFSLARYGMARQPNGGQLGIVGTDFLSLLTLDFVFGRSGSVVVGDEACAADVVARRGLVGIKQTGFYSRDPRRVLAGRLNVPVVFLRIGDIATWAQADTGYDDGGRGTAIDINTALYDKLVASGLVLTREQDVTLGTCDGSATAAAYRIAAQASVETESGQPLAPLRDVLLLLKTSTRCGGIATLAEPAAQVGMSVIAKFGEVVFDPRAGMLWVRPVR